jgi:hypothetical protein
MEAPRSAVFQNFFRQAAQEAAASAKQRNGADF